MRRETRTFCEIEKDLSRVFHKKDDGLIIVDLGAMIDIQRQSEVRRECIETCMGQIDKYGLPIVTDATLGETEAHASIKINSHKREISPCVYGFAKIYNKNFYEARTRLNPQKRESSGYDAWLLVRNYLGPLTEASDESRHDIVSDADKDIAMNAFVFAMTPGQIIDPVGQIAERIPGAVCVLTSDGNHVAKMTHLLAQSFCKNLEVVETRK